MRTFAIRKKGTEDYLPSRRGKTRGYSNDEPLPNGGKNGPRFFPDVDSARKALTCWLQGVFEVKHHYGYDAFGEYDEDYDLEIKPQPHRKEEEMEIVEFELKEIRTYGRLKTKETVNGSDANGPKAEASAEADASSAL